MALNNKANPQEGFSLSLLDKRRRNKQRLSVSVSMKTIELIDESLKLEKFRNKSHVVEFSINKVLKEQFKDSDKGGKENE